MNVLVVGGTGLLGRRVAERLRQEGDDVWISTRRSERPGGLHGDIQTVQWDTRSRPDWNLHIDAIVNLSGESLIGQYWTESVKEEIWRSRVEVNRAISAWIQERRDPPRVFVTASAVGFYGPHPDHPVTEEDAAGEDFLARLCKEWELAAFEAESPRTRVVATRFGIMLDPHGGALEMMVPLWKAFLGGSVGAGHQPFPWISTRDAARAVSLAVHDVDLRGPLNVVAPERTTNREFTRALGTAVHRPAPWYVPPLALRLLYGDGAEILVHGQSALPKRLEERGFEWHDPRLQPTLDRLVDGG